MDLKNSELPKILRDLRKESGYTQDELSVRIGISRETISKIENAKQDSMESLEMEVVGKWWKVCRTKAKEDTRTQFMNQIMVFFKFFTQKL